MALSKRTYIANETKFTAQNLNDIQDAIITLEGYNSNTRLNTAEENIETLTTSLATLSAKFHGGNIDTNDNIVTLTKVKRCLAFMFRRSTNATPNIALIDSWGAITWVVAGNNNVWNIAVTNVSAGNNTVRLTNFSSSYCCYGVIEF